MMHPDQALVYRLPLRTLSDAALKELRQCMSLDELAKADRYVVQPPRLQFTACRAALRQLLAQLLDCEPAEIAFQYSELGKPQLDLERTPAAAAKRELAQTLQFNVSHSGDYGLIAIARSPVGIDIERLQPRIHVRSLVTQLVSSRELPAWEAIAEPLKASQIIRLWVCKEALLKAMGLGIAECLQQIGFALPISAEHPFEPSHIEPALQLHLEEAGDCRFNSWLMPKSWRAHPIDIDQDYFAIAVTGHRIPQIELWEWGF